MNHSTYYLIHCRFGQKGCVGFSRCLHRDEVMSRTKYSGCGGKEAKDLCLLLGSGAGEIWTQELVGVPVHPA